MLLVALWVPVVLTRANCAQLMRIDMYMSPYLHVYNLTSCYTQPRSWESYPLTTLIHSLS